MHKEYFTVNDGCKIAFQSSLPLKEVAGAAPEKCVLLMHGFSGSSDYFIRNFTSLSKSLWVIAPDMRGHGDSSQTRGGYHVARLAADLSGLVAHIHKTASVSIVPVGCSIGAAVLWTYVELFGCNDFAGFVFVDQAPLQDRSVFDGWDESKAHTGCYDEKTMLAAQYSWINNSQKAYIDLAIGCLGYRYAPKEEEEGISAEQQAKDEAFFTNISAKCDQTWLARLLADHTRYDHREAIETITVPVLVMAGRRSSCFPLEGMLESVRRVEKSRPGLARSSVFDSGHWLFYEEPERFNKEIAEFVKSC